MSHQNQVLITILVPIDVLKWCNQKLLTSNQASLHFSLLMTKQLIYNTLFFKKEVVLELIQNSTSDLKVYVINISQGPKYYRIWHRYINLLTRGSITTRKNLPIHAFSLFGTVIGSIMVKKYGYIKSSDLISE